MEKEFSSQTVELEALMRKVTMLLNKRTKNTLKDFDITPPQFMALLTLHHKKESIMSDLVQRMHMSPPTATGIIDRLVKQCYVERFRSEEDRRIVKVRLTEKGQKLLEEVREVRLSILEADLKELTKDELEQLIKILEKLHSTMIKDTI